MSVALCTRLNRRLSVPVGARALVPNLTNYDYESRSDLETFFQGF